MSSEPSNADKLRALFDAFETGGPEAAAPHVERSFHPEVEFNPMPAGSAGGRTYRGLDGVKGFFSELHDGFDAVRYESRQFYTAGEDTVIVMTTLYAADRSTGVPLRQELSLLYEFAGDLAIRVTAFDTPAEALEAAERGHAGA
jgi:ketosteroid isomerase-like protein